MGRRFYDDQSFADNNEFVLGTEPSHHIARVLRMREGEALTVFNGRGGEWPATISAVHKQAVTISTGTQLTDNRTPDMAVTIALPAIKGERMDTAVQKATELGARRFQLLQTEHSDVRLSGDRLQKKIGHWQRVAISACEQCGMNLIPEIVAPISLEQLLGDADGLTLFGQPGAPALRPADLSGARRVTVVTGPEGGFSDAELQLLERAGAKGMALGQRVLRAETAPLAILAGLWGLTGQ